MFNIFKIAIALWTCLVLQDACAQSWTANKPSRLIIPQVVGGGADTIGRIIAQNLSEKIGQPIFVDNKVGSNGGVGVETLMHAPNDGSQLILVFTSLMTINPAVYSKLSYDPLRDLRVLGSICEVPMVLVANTQMPVNTLSEFIAWAKTKPGEVFGASSGNGAFSHLLLELFKSKTGLALAHIPFKGEAPAVQHVISNQDAIVLFSTPSPVLGPAMSNKLKVLGVSTRQRMNQLPNVPSLSEQGLGDINESFWYGLAVSASTPNPIAESLSQSVWESAKSPPLIQALDKVGCASQALTANEFQERIKQDHAKYTNIAKSVGMRVD